jgi:hypothetical protein
MNLYFVRWDDENGDNQDALVRAENPGRAGAFWRHYFELGEAAEPYYIGLVPPGDDAGVIDWDDIIPKYWEPK